MDKITTIRVKESTKRKLADYGSKDDTYEKIILDLMEEVSFPN